MTDKPDNTAAVKALCKAQAEMTGAIKDKENPHFRTKYADLGAVQDACLPALHKHGFAITTSLGNNENGGFLETALRHESGATFCCCVPLIVDKQNMQGLGSAITYARRYGLMCLSGVAPEDDDGNKAADNPPTTDYPTTAPSPPVAEQFVATAADINREIKKIGTIDDMDELASYWRVLNKAQPSVAAHIDVIVAKNERKSVISGEEK